MPHLNVETFVTQYLWLIIILGLLYFKVATSPELGEIIKLRNKSQNR